ncbi:MAG: BolA family transcriptional regulator [Zoogloeaceae bacterium]|nr:BolA family transcriptional regulator [Zoogloeaceae bacterium]
MTTTEEKIRQRLAALAPLAVDITDDRAKHAGHAGARSGGGHYRLTIVSPQFTGLNTLARHRLVYATLGDLMHSEIHALAIDLAEPPSND